MPDDELPSIFHLHRSFEVQRREFERTGSPVYVYEAVAACANTGEELPDWVRDYLLVDLVGSLAPAVKTLVAEDATTKAGSRRSLASRRGALLSKAIGLSTGEGRGSHVSDHRRRLAEIATFYYFEAEFGGLPDGDTLVELEVKLGPSDTQLRRAYKAGRKYVFQLLGSLSEDAGSTVDELRAAKRAIDSTEPNPALVAAIEPVAKKRREAVLALIKSMKGTKGRPGH